MSVSAESVKVGDTIIPSQSARQKYQLPASCTVLGKTAHIVLVKDQSGTKTHISLRWFTGHSEDRTNDNT